VHMSTTGGGKPAGLHNVRALHQYQWQWWWPYPVRGKFPRYPYKSHPGAHRHNSFGWDTGGCSPIFREGAYVEHDSLESTNPHFVNICLTDTFDCIAPFTGRSPYKFCLMAGRGRGGARPRLFGKSVELRVVRTRESRPD
jgi:hypothetical protein